MRPGSVLERWERQRPATVASALIIVCAVGAATSATVPGRDERSDGSVWYGWNYEAAFWPLVAGLAGAGLVMAARPAQVGRAATVAAILGAQAAGHGRPHQPRPVRPGLLDPLGRRARGGAWREPGAALAAVAGSAAVVASVGTAFAP